jgi:hypothetical protein
VAINKAIEITFNSWIYYAYSNGIRLKEYDTGTSIAYNLNWEQNVLKITPTVNLKTNTKYYVEIDKDYISDYYFVWFQGLEKDGYVFTTGDGINQKLNVQFMSGYNENDKKTLSYSTEWNIDFFQRQSSVMNMSLARASMALSAAAYDSKPSLNRTDGELKKSLTGIGFDTFKSINYNPPHSQNHSDHVGAVFAQQRNVNLNGYNYTLVVAVLRGTTSGEWHSNFNVADATKGQANVDHEGFATAAREIERDLIAYLESLPNGTNVKLWITGHSRGAAIANIIGNDFSYGQYSATNYNYSNRILLNRTNIFTYTFATPSVTTATASVNKGNNIFNFVNMEDFVPAVPLKEWGYGRSGTTYLLPPIVTATNSYGTQLQRMFNSFKEITGINYFVFYKNGYADVKKLSNYIYDAAPSVREIYSGILTTRSFFKNLAGYLVKGETVGGYLNAAGSLFISNLKQKDILAFMQANSEVISFAHTPETYISWLDNLDASLLNSMQKMLIAQYKCPVDLKIYDSNGILVGEVINNSINTTIADAVHIVVEGDEKTVYLSGEDNYRIEIIGSDSGTMDYYVSEVMLDDGVQRRVCFYDIPLENGKTMYSTLNAANIVSIPADEYTLTVAGGNPVFPDEVLEGNDVENIKISVSASNGGEVTGNQILTKGDRATISAIAESGYSFVGWYESNALVTTEVEHSFIAMNSHAFEARFINTGNQIGTEKDGNDKDSTSDSIEQNSIITTSNTINATYWIESAEAKTLVKFAQDNGLFYARTRRIGSTGIRKAALAAITGLRYTHDTLLDKAVQVRISISEPNKITQDLLMSGYVKGVAVDKVKTVFEKWYKNKIRAIHLEQRYPWGQSVEVAAKVDFTGMDTKNLCFYSYNKEANSYAQIKEPKYWFDKNGYIHFATGLAGDILISEGSLAKE